MNGLLLPSRAAVDNTPRPSDFPCAHIYLSPRERRQTVTGHSNLHILPLRLCKIRIVASSSSAMVQADCCCCSGTFSAGWFIISVYECRQSGERPAPLPRHGPRRAPYTLLLKSVWRNTANLSQTTCFGC